MPDPRAVDAYKIYNSASQKFDCFVTGGAGVVLAFTLKELPIAAGRSASWLLPLGWALLLLALGTGMLALSRTVEAYRLAAHVHHHRVAGSSLRDALLRDPHEPKDRGQTGTVLTPEAAQATLAQYAQADTELDSAAARQATVAIWVMRVRNVALLTALGAISLWRWVNL